MFFGGGRGKLFGLSQLSYLELYAFTWKIEIYSVQKENNLKS